MHSGMWPGIDTSDRYDNNDVPSLTVKAAIDRVYNRYAPPAEDLEDALDDLDECLLTGEGNLAAAERAVFLELARGSDDD